jgi:hypothetical protein
VVLFVYVECTSSTIGVYNCNADEIEKFGCATGWADFPKRKVCKDNEDNKVMTWAYSPSENQLYEITAGGISGSKYQTSHYVPDSYIDIHLLVTDFTLPFRGLLLYAVDSSGSKVGSWPVLIESPPFFLEMDTIPGHACTKSVMHASARIKPFHSIFKFKTPPAGTGPVFFKILIKQGDANTGAFYIPKMPLVLKEKRTTVVERWFEVDPGQTCNDFCTSMNLFCNEKQMQDVGDSLFYEQISATSLCKLPVLNSCSGPYMANNSYCYAGESDHSCENSTLITCDTVLQPRPNGTNLCNCVTQRELLHSGSARSYSFSLFSLLMILCAFIPNSKNRAVVFVLVIVLVSVSLPGAYSHNWINSESRAFQKANTYPPCLRKRTAQPHIQVGVGQDFLIEWMIGHSGRDTYFVILHEDDQEKMAEHTFKMLDSYIQDGLSYDKISDPYWQKYHRVDSMDTAGEYGGVISVSSPYYMERPVSYNGRFKGDGFMFSYVASDQTEDHRIEYQNDKYYWFESVHKFKHSKNLPSEFDTARFEINARHGLGRYIVHYMWGGYYDCIDVDVMATNVELPYGNFSDTDSWTRIDHCFFPDPQDIRQGCFEVITGPHYCLDQCARQGPGSCSGVQVVPFKHPDTVYEGFLDVETIPWDKQPCKGTYKDFKDAPDDTHICYSVNPRTPTDVLNTFVVTDDPTSPYFYGTCYVRNPNKIMLGYTFKPLNLPEKVDWRYIDSCISCDDHETWKTAILPFWKLTDECRNCDLEPGTARPGPPEWSKIGNNSACDGFGGYWRTQIHHECSRPHFTCVKKLSLRGNPTLNIDECKIIAARDPECSNVVIARKPDLTSDNPYRNFDCYCYKSDECCFECSPVSNSRYDIYELIPSDPDPLCERGLKEINGTGCCSLGCEAIGCLNGSIYQRAGLGFCCSTCMMRSCDEYGPPCEINPYYVPPTPSPTQAPTPVTNPPATAAPTTAPPPPAPPAATTVAPTTSPTTAPPTAAPTTAPPPPPPAATTVAPTTTPPATGTSTATTSG